MKYSQSMGIFSLRFRVLIVLAVGLSLVTSFAVAQTSSALSEKSPNPADMVSIGAPYPAPWGGAAEHLLKNENTSQIMAINMAAYYTNANERNVIDIYWSQTPAGQRRCTISPGGGVRTEGYALITITAANKKNPSSTIRSVYRIPYANMCDNTSTRTNVGNNSDGKSGNWQRNIFSARYPVPGNFNAGTVNIDPLTGRYKVYVTVALTPNVIRTNGTSDRQEVGFRVRTSGTGAKLGILRDSAEAARNFSTVGVRGRDYGIQERFAFGLPCNEEDLPDPADPTNAKGIVRRVAIYDADVTGRFGALDFWVEEKAPSGARERLPADRFERGSNLYIKSTSGGVVFSSTAGTGQNSSVYIKNMRPGYEYSLVIEGEKERQSNNLIGIGLPGDAIYGEVTCASDYNLTPDITFVDGSMSPGENLPIVSKVTPANSGVGTDPTRWVVTKFVYNNNQPIDALRAFNSVRDTQQDPCGAYPAANRDSCSSTWSTSPNSDKANEEFSSSKEETFTYRATSGEIGKRVCFVTSISYPRDSAHRLANQTWRHSRLQCALIAKRPKVQVLGTDLRVAGDIKTSVSPDIDGKTFGSWVEYGVFSTGLNITASSGAGLREGNPNNLVAKDAWSQLTFSNTTDPYGGYTPLPTLSNARAYFDKTNLGATGPLNLGASGVYDAGNITLGSIPALPPGTSIIIRADDVTINGDISVNNTNRSNIGDLSQIVIVADKINITGNVKNIDAWLLTRPGKGGINTCSDGPATLTDRVCNEPLAINGAIMTDELQLRRTHGAGDADPGVAAEVLRLRPDAQLWAFNYANKTDRAQTVYMTELPPRF